MKLKSTASKRTASAGAVSKSRNASRKGARKYPFLALCIRNDRDAFSLQKGKAYRIIKPLANDPSGSVRVIDEENEDYLYPADWFVPIEVPQAAKKTSGGPCRSRKIRDLCAEHNGLLFTQAEIDAFGEIAKETGFKFDTASLKTLDA